MPRTFLTALLMFACLCLIPGCGGSETETDADTSTDTDTSADDGAAASSTGSTREQSVQAILDQVKKFPEILSGVKDQESAKQASDQIGSLAGTVQPLIDKFKSYGDVTGDEAQSLESKFKPQFDAIKAKVTEQMTRIVGENPLLLGALNTAMGKLGTVMQGMDLEAE